MKPIYDIIKNMDEYATMQNLTLFILFIIFSKALTTWSSSFSFSTKIALNCALRNLAFLLGFHDERAVSTKGIAKVAKVHSKAITAAKEKSFYFPLLSFRFWLQRYFCLFAFDGNLRKKNFNWLYGWYFLGIVEAIIICFCCCLVWYKNNT